jgi:hypothetical protein
MGGRTCGDWIHPAGAGTSAVILSSNSAREASAIDSVQGIWMHESAEDLDLKRSN